MRAGVGREGYTWLIELPDNNRHHRHLPLNFVGSGPLTLPSESGGVAHILVRQMGSRLLRGKAASRFRESSAHTARPLPLENQRQENEALALALGSSAMSGLLVTTP